MCLPLEKPSPTAVRITDGWYAPLGGVLIAAAGAFSLVGFPLDDVWHRLFGQDVTLWGPTHLMLIGGAAMTLVGLAVLLVEAGAANAPAAGAASCRGRASCAASRSRAPCCSACRRSRPSSTSACRSSGWSSSRC